MTASGHMVPNELPGAMPWSPQSLEIVQMYDFAVNAFFATIIANGFSSRHRQAQQ